MHVPRSHEGADRNFVRLLQPVVRLVASLMRYLTYKDSILVVIQSVLTYYFFYFANDFYYYLVYMRIRVLF